MTTIVAFLVGAPFWGSLAIVMFAVLTADRR